MLLLRLILADLWSVTMVERVLISLPTDCRTSAFVLPISWEIPARMKVCMYPTNI